MNFTRDFLVLLPFLAFVALFVNFRGRTGCWRSSLLKAAVIWGVLLTFITELLSIFRLLTQEWIAGAWAVALLVLCLRLYRSHQQFATQTKKREHEYMEQLTRPLQLLLCATGLLAILVGLVAVVAPPNNWDSMAYHMPRVVHWMEHLTVAHYPTSFTPQLYQGPWSEFAIMHLQILYRGDRFANSVQWFSMLGTTIGVSLIAKTLGASIRGQVFAVVVALTIPMGILQGATTQNDYVVTLWLVILLWYVLGAARQELEFRDYWWGAGCSLGLALLTKGTAYIYAVPIVVYGMISLVRQSGRRMLKLSAAIGGVVLLINIGHYVRNWELFGSPLGTGEESYANEVFTVPTFASNVVRNLTLHVSTPSRWINTRIEESTRRFHKLIGADMDDPRTTAWGKFGINSFQPSEDYSGNPLHALLILAAIGAFLACKDFRTTQVGVYFIILTSMFGVFCLLLKWQPWHSRLHLPLFVFFAPFVAVVLSNIRPTVAYITAWALLIASLPWVLLSRERPLLPLGVAVSSYYGNRVWSDQLLGRSVLTANRTDLYFTSISWFLRDPYLGAADFLKSRNDVRIGLLLPYDAWEYPLWVLLGADGTRDVQLEHLNVNNISAVATDHIWKTFEPSAIVKVRVLLAKDMLAQSPETEGDKIDTEFGTYIKRWSMQPVEIFVRE